MIRVILALALLAAPQIAGAEPVLDQGAVDACTDAAIAANAPVANCVQGAHAPCLSYASEAPAAAIACFRQAKADWAGLISARLTALKPALPGPVWDVLEINTRYDILGNLVQCDRMTELALLQVPGGEQVELQKARCEATASGLVHMKLALQASELEQKP